MERPFNEKLTIWTGGRFRCEAHVPERVECSSGRNLRAHTTAGMFVGLIVAAALLGQAADASPPQQAYGPATPAPKPATPPVKTAASECPAATPDPSSNAIVVCAPKPQGYRIDPDVLEAKREKKEALAGRPKPPDNLKDHGCKVVGPAPCMDAPTVNLLAAVGTAAEMADRLAKGEEVGSMFVTDPQPTEYQLYLEARKRREAKEAEAAAKARQKAAQTVP